jgi:para-nitrobenzyl esterase
MTRRMLVTGAGMLATCAAIWTTAVWTTAMWTTLGTTASAAVSDPVRTESGLVSGIAGVSANVRAFKGIPYAAPPLGANRWRAPQPAATWDGVRSGDAFGNRCIAGGGAAAGRGGRAGGAPAPPAAAPAAPAAQVPPAPSAPAPNAPAPQPPTAEDCLYANVWTSAASAGARRPVMVWIYGGGFTGGSGSEQRYDGDRLAAKGVVVVTFNYRLGQFGFFAHPELTKESGRNASGNYGMMDSLAALQWVKRNIAGFGGDPNNVTVFGESAGAIMVSALVGSPHAKGLFKRAITQSGAWMGLTMGAMGTLAQREQAGVKAMADMGVASIADLRAKSTEDVGAGIRTPAGLVVDGYLIPEDLSFTFAQGRQNDVELIAGSNADEGTFFPGGPAASAEGYRRRAEERFGAMAGAHLQLYPAGSDQEAGASYLTAYSDETSWNMRQSAALQNKRGKKSYAYFFTRVPKGADGKPSPRGSSHTVEIQYAFNNPTGLNWDETDKTLADRMSSYWVNFATKGDPNGPGLPIWPTYKNHATGRVMVLGDTVQAESASPAAKLAFFDAAYARQLGQLRSGTN